MTRRRLRQANLFGPAGFVSADDGEVIEFSQAGFAQKPWHRSVAELGGKTAENTEHMVTETLIRGMYQYWKKDGPERCALPQGRSCGPAEPDPRCPDEDGIA